MTSGPRGTDAASDDARLLDWLNVRAESRDAGGDAGGGPADAVVEWATAALTRVCPIVTGLLAFDDRLRAQVVEHLRGGDRPGTTSEWGLAFASGLESDSDPWISWAAKVDSSTLVVERSRRRADPACPGDPMRAILLITSGADPRKE